MFNGFYYLFQNIKKYPKATLLFFLLFLVGAVFIVQKITFNEDITRIIPKNNIDKNTTQIVSEMSFTDKVSVIFKKKNKATNEDITHAAQTFVDTLPLAKNYYQSIQGIVDEDLFQQSFAFVYRNLPLYLNENDYQIIDSKLNTDSISVQSQRNVELLTGGNANFMKDIVVNDPLQISFLALKKLQQFQGSNDYTFKDGFLFSKNDEKIVLFINPKFGGSETKHNEIFVNQLNDIKRIVEKSNPNIEVMYFGSPFIAVANAQQIKHDIFTTVVISVSALMLMLIFYYRNIWVPIIVMIPSIFGGLFGLACLYFLRSEISAISLSIAAILIGITIDYALHFLTHSKSNQNTQQLFKDVTKPLLMSSTTTAIAFLCLLFVHSDALVDLGIFASISVVATAVFTLIILPHIYKGKAIKHSHIIDKVAQYPFEKNKVLISVTLLLVIISAFTYHKVTFDGNLAKINFMPKDQEAAEKELYHDQEIAKNLFVVAYDTNERNVLQTNNAIYEKLQSMDLVDHVQSVSSLIPSEINQQKAIKRWQQFWNTEKTNQTIQTIENQSVKNGFVENTHAAFYKALQKNYQTISLDTLKRLNPQIYHEFVHGKKQHLLSTIVTLKPENRDAFVANFNKEFKNKNALVIDRQALNEQYLGYLVNDFNDLVTYSFIAVFGILFLFYRRIELVITAAIPIALTGFITTGIMGLLNIPFNIFSTIVCTLVFGHGIDFTIFMTSALQKQYTDGKNEMPIYRTSIILAVLTTILAIGALVFAQHPALKSIASIALIGVSVAVLVTFVLYPLLFQFLFFNRVKKGLSPVTLWLVIQSVIMFTYYIFASLLVSIFMRCFFWILPLPRQKKWKLFSKIMSVYMKSVLSLKPSVSKKVIHKERFNQQSVIISNHTSFLDSLTIGMAHPYIVYIVNDWVYKSPVFGRAVKFLGFYPATKGVEKGLTPLEERIGTDFSVMIFPEGTRSTTTEIGRFHKGAFFMAEELNLPIQPVYIHGNADLLPKNDFIIYDAPCHVYVGEPIALTDDRFGSNYSERTKKISAFFKAEYSKIRLQAEDENYFKQKLFLNFLYKEGNILQMVKTDFKKHKTIYHRLFTLISDKAQIAHITSNFGQVDFLLANQFPTRKITTFNINLENRSIANASYIVRKFNVKYTDVIDDIWKKADVAVLSHLNEFNTEIPSHIHQIITVCCTFSENFNGFKEIIHEGQLKMYQRIETN
ncbi:MMPL family transporter [Flavobacterium sp. xlx-214]|uniref:1-acyl-sn-glycerol-3-phosphate acyltransferase n=1 Tax=unclassified Flavobacterium TaxID=196869 RepID=UPI0013D6CCDC|nr:MULTISPECIES: 1-acyl-sn-glycerol-3-phosphate acyltransferase [unclassified Flavobacterium]MBA5792092.1 MMPL family transporter [Flavobacterium sp. xlx-221]QMI84338.1 MMPL family transporter [Flavobacterium sp. xlx-214]